MPTETTNDALLHSWLCGSRGIGGHGAPEPRLEWQNAPRSPNEAAKPLRRAQEGADVARVRARSLQHSLSSLRSAHLLLCRTVNI